MIRLVLPLVWLLGCGRDAPPDAPECAEQTYYADRDGDGHGDPAGPIEACRQPESAVATGDDCDDERQEVHPGAPELCNGLDDDCNESVDDEPIDEIAAYVDADNDGFGDPTTLVSLCEPPEGTVSVSGDCDDGDAAIHPDAPEMCNGFDDDCDGLPDDEDDTIVGGTDLYDDADGDGYGAPGAVRSVCDVPPGAVVNGDDCDDANASFHAVADYFRDIDGDGYGSGDALPRCVPAADLVTVAGDCEPFDAGRSPGAPETCNGVDDNCDGLYDEYDPLLVGDPWGMDSDGDGYGDDTRVFFACYASWPWVERLGDCDDDDASINPASVEACDGVDQDCDGTIDEDAVYYDWFADTDSDGYGDPDDSTNDCLQPDGYVRDGTDCDDAVEDVHPFAEEVCFDAVDQDCDDATNDCVLEVDDGMLSIEGDEHSLWLGAYMDVTDLNADGMSDVLLSSSTGEDTYGTVFVVYGPATGTIASSDAALITSTVDDVGFGRVVSGGDANGDGSDDVLVGAEYTRATTAPATYVFLGPVTARAEIETADAVLAARYEPYGVLEVTDADGDGESDVVVADTRNNVYVTSGAVSGEVDLATAATYTFTKPGAVSRSPIATLGDADGDGIDELVIGACGDPGFVYMVDGGATPGSYDVDAVAAATVRGSDDFATSLTTADLDNDGLPDLLVGAPGYAVDLGRAYAFLGPLSGELGPAAAVARWESSDGFGDSVAACDVDGDKTNDVVLADSNDDTVFVQLGTPSGVVDAGTLVAIGHDGTNGFGFGLRCVPDWSGDDASELLIGAWFEDGGNGRAYVFPSDLLY